MDFSCSEIMRNVRITQVRRNPMPHKEETTVFAYFEGRLKQYLVKQWWHLLPAVTGKRLPVCWLSSYYWGFFKYKFYNQKHRVFVTSYIFFCFPYFFSSFFFFSFFLSVLPSSPCSFRLTLLNAKATDFTHISRIMQRLECQKMTM